MPRTVLPNQRKGRQSAGFTLIEILVVISIIVLLAGITIPVMFAFFRNAAEAQTKVLLKQLDSAVAEYKAQTGQDLFAREPGEPVDALYDYPDGAGTAGSDPRSAESVAGLSVFRLRSVQPAVDMMNTVNRQYKLGVVRDKDPGPNFDAGPYPISTWTRPAGEAEDADISDVEAVQDAWDRPVRFFPGLRAMEVNGYSKTQLESTNNIEDRGMRRRKGAYFASAGPDGLWGAYLPDDTVDPDVPGAEDNIYSFEAD